MMKKLIVLGIVAMMVMAIAGGASAFVFQTSAKNGAGSGSTGTVTIGNASTTVGTWTAPMGDYVAWALPANQEWVPGNATTWQIRNQNPAYTAEKVWAFGIWATAGFAQPATVKLWAANIGGLDPTKEYGFFDAGGNLLDSAFFAATSNEASAPIAFQFTAPVTTDPANGAAVLYFGQVIPEPGSILALASGLVGLVGFGIRRRK